MVGQRRKHSRIWKPHLARLAILAMIVQPLWTTCSLFTADVFPSWLPMTSGVIELSSLEAEADLGPSTYWQWVAHVSDTDAGGNDLILVMLGSQSGEALLALDAETLTAEKVWTRHDYPEIGYYKGTTVNGFVCGRLEFNLSDLDAAPVHVMLPNEDARVCRDGDTNLMVYTSLNTTLDINLEVRGADLAAAPVQVAQRPYSTAPVSLYIRGLLVRDEGKISLALNSGNTEGLTVYSLDSIEDMNSTTALVDDTTVTSHPAQTGESSFFWLTDDGYVTGTWNNGLTLNLYDHDSGDQLGSYTIQGDTEGLGMEHFSADGTRWFIRDEIRNRLFSLETWWSP